MSISQHVASLGFEDAPDYEFLRQCLQQLPDPQVQLHDRVGQLTPQPQLQQQQASNGGQWDAETSKPAAWPDWADPAALESQHQQQPPQQHVFSDAVLLTPQSPQQEVSPAPGYVSSPSAAAAGEPTAQTYHNPPWAIPVVQPMLAAALSSIVHWVGEAAASSIEWEKQQLHPALSTAWRSSSPVQHCPLRRSPLGMIALVTAGHTCSPCMCVVNLCAAAAQQLHPLEPEGEQMAKRRRLSNGLPEQHM